jgi:hypothetical protein
MSLAKQATKSRPPSISLLCFSLWFNALLASLVALILLTSNTLRAALDDSFGWFGWGILLLGILALYAAVTAFGLWHIKKWAIILCGLYSIGIALVCLVAVASAILAGELKQNWFYLFLVIGAIGVCADLWKLWRKVQ